MQAEPSISISMVLRKAAAAAAISCVRPRQSSAIEIEAELGQLDGDVAVDSGIGERAEHPDIGIAGAARLGRRGHIFAQVIQDYALAGARQAERSFRGPDRESPRRRICG